MQSYRITKYDPQKRTADGAYLPDDWTDFSDIGKVFEGVELTASGYCRVEAEYVAAALRFFDASGLEQLRVTGLENRQLSENLKAHRKSTPSLYEPAFETFEPAEDRVVNRDQIELLCKMILRNLLWCRLEVDQQFHLHFGWDFYMYVATAGAWQDAARQVASGALYVEPFTSPYGRPPDAVPVVRLSRYDEDGMQIGDTTELASVSLPALRKLLGFSSEHPLFGEFNATPAMIRALREKHGVSLQPAASYSLDLTGYQGDGG